MIESPLPILGNAQRSTRPDHPEVGALPVFAHALPPVDVPQPSTPTDVSPRLHVAIIMDGNGRWAAARGRPRSVGHRMGARAVRRVVEAAPKQGIGTLTLYAFSADNWQRPEQEVNTLMRLFLLV